MPGTRPSIADRAPGKGSRQSVRHTLTILVHGAEYGPQTGRFTQEDPIGLAGGLNLYGFADGDPLNFSDPFGLSPDTLEAVTERQTSTENPGASNRAVCVDQSMAAGVRSFFSAARVEGINITMNNGYREHIQPGQAGRPSGGANSQHRAGFAFDINTRGLPQATLGRLNAIAGGLGFITTDLGHYQPKGGAAAVYGSFDAGVVEAQRSYGAGECSDANVQVRRSKQ